MTDQPQYPSYPGPERPASPPGAGQPPPGYQPPPPPGYQPPPPGYGQAPPAYGTGQPFGSTPTNASWWSRVGAYLLDSIIGLAVIVVPLITGLIITFKDAETDPATGEITGGVAAPGVLILVLTLLLYVGFDIWNRGVRTGTKGQSLGKRIVGIRIVKVADGQLLGGGGGFLRWFVAFVFNLISCVGLLDVLWPLWDDKKQTLHDKVMGSMAVQA